MPVETHPGLNLNERLLFHGAPSHLVERLAAQGLDPRFAGEHRGKLWARSDRTGTSPAGDCQCAF